MKVGYLLIGTVVLFAASLLFAALSEAKIDPETIAGMWLFDEDGGKVANDSSGNDNHGDLMNKPKWEDGKFGGALEFDGLAAHVNCGNSKTLDITEELTVMAWVRFDAVDYKGATGGLFTIAAKGYPDALVPHAGWWFSHDNRNGGQGFNYTCFGKGAGGWAGGGNNLNGRNFQFDKGEWYHIAITVGDSIGKMYVDATELGNEKQFLDLELSDTTRDLTIGSAGNNGWHFNGLIDEVAIFSVALQEADIKTVMERGLLESFDVDASGKFTTTWANIKAR